MPVNRDMVPFGAALQADVVALQNGLTSVLGLVEQGLAEEGATVESLRTALTLAKEELLATLRAKEEAQAIGDQTIGGFGGEPKIEWSEAP